MEAPQQESRQPYNAKWRQYLLLNITSLINFVTIEEALQADLPHYFSGGNHDSTIVFGAASFAVTLLILLLDVVPVIREKFSFRNLADGKAEGFTVLGLVLWWSAGVIVLTRAGAIGYAALNNYFSAWACLFVAIAVLDKWGGEHDILTLRQLTRISPTLPYWWTLFWSCLVLLGSAADTIRLATTDYVLESCNFAVGLATLSLLISFFFVLSHYEFLDCAACRSWMTYGGWFEICWSVLVNILLISGLHDLTGAGAIASTVSGSGGKDPTSEDYVPGSNVYFATWAAFCSSIGVSIKWKEARAIKFARTGDTNVEEQADDGEVAADVMRMEEKSLDVEEAAAKGSAKM